jgi:hypothetical protein
MTGRGELNVGDVSVINLKNPIFEKQCAVASISLIFCPVKYIQILHAVL